MSEQLKEAIVAIVQEQLREAGLIDGTKTPSPSTGKGGKTTKDDDADTGKPTIESLTAKCQKLQADKGKPALMEVVSAFKLKKIGDLKPAQFAKFDTALDAALADDEDPDPFGA